MIYSASIGMVATDFTILSNCRLARMKYSLYSLYRGRIERNILTTNCIIASDYFEMISIFNQIVFHISPVTYFAGVIFPEEVHWPVSTVVNRG